MPSIEGHFDEAIAAVGVLEQIRAGREQGVDGHVIACFGDPGLLAARELARGPVIGIAEAAMHMATMVATRFSIVTTLPRTLIIARHLLHQYGFHQHCAALHAIDLPVLALEDGSGLAQEKVRERCIRALKEDGSGAIVLGCGGMATPAQELTRELRVPVIDGVSAAVKMVESLVALAGDQQAWGLSVPGEKSVKRTVSVVKSILKGAGDGREPGTLSSRSARLCREPPHARWPGGARIAVQFVLNYEEGAENHVLHGDAGSEQFLSDIIGAASYPARHMSMDSLYEYGSRAGFWRIHREFSQRGLPLTVFGVAMALARHPEIVAAIKAADYDVVSHGWRWIHYQHMDIAEEREHLQKAVQVLTDLFGKPPTGWYTGRDSPNTRQLVVEHGGFDYDSDYYGDDLPFWSEVACSDGSQRPHLIVPYTLDANDMRFATAQGFNTAEQFYTYLKDSFDVLYAEGETAPKMMSVGMHCRLLGRPGRFRALQRFLDYIQQHDKVWVCTRQQIADHWRETHPYRG